MKYIAYTVKGLEKIAEKEILSFDSSAKIIEVSTKKVIFDSNISLKNLVSLKTIDDLQIYIAKIDISSCKTLKDYSKEILKHDFKIHLSDVRRLRNVTENTFSITMGTYKAKYKPNQLTEVLASEISTKYSWQYTEKNRENSDLRIVGEKDILYLSIRATKQSLFNREYKTKSLEGSLRSTIASSMVQLALQDRISSSLKLIDTFCGSGTILAEGLMLGLDVFGSDINPKAITASKLNMKNLGFKSSDNYSISDAKKTTWKNNQFDLGVSNLPWDKQIEVESITDLYIGALKEYKRILKTDFTLCLLVHNPDLLIKHIKKIFGTNIEISKFKLEYLGQTPTIVLARSV